MLMREDVLLGKIAKVKEDLAELEQQLIISKGIIARQNTTEVFLRGQIKRLEEINRSLEERNAVLTRLRLNERMSDQLIGINDRQSMETEKE